MIRKANPDETPRLIQIAGSTGIFKPEEAQLLLEPVLREFHAGQLGLDNFVEVVEVVGSRAPAGWVYYAPSQRAEGIWDLWWIGVSPAAQKNGYGQSLLEHVERMVTKKNGRVLVIETSSVEALAPARRFYERNRYQNCGRIPNFYGPIEDKIIFAKTLRP